MKKQGLLVSILIGCAAFAAAFTGGVTAVNAFGAGLSRGNDIWLEDFAGCGGETIEVDVMISNPDTPVDAFGFYISYCADKLAFVGCAPGDLDPGWTMFGCNDSVAGEIRAAGFIVPGGVPAGSSGSLVKLTFQVVCQSCNNGDTCLLEFSQLSGDLEGWNPQSGTFTYSCPSPTPVPTPAAADSIWIGDSSGCTGDTIQVDVMISNPETPVDSFGFYLGYRPDMIEYVGCESGDLDPDWQMFDCNAPAPGEVRAAGFAYPGSIPAGSNGTLVKLTFLVKCDICSNGDQNTLFLYNLTDDLNGWDVQTGLFTYSCPPTPTPSPTPADLVWLEDFSGCTGQTVNVDVMISNGDTAVDSFGFYMEYCTDMLQYVSCSEGTLDPGWEMFDCYEPESGEIRVAAFAYPNTIPAGNTGSIVTLTFMVACPACENDDECVLNFTNLSGDFTGWPNQSGAFAYYCEPTPVPTPVTNDVIWLEDFTECHGSMVETTVMIDNQDTPVDSFGITLNYCTDMLQYVSCSEGTLDPGWQMFGCNEPTVGQIVLAGFSYPENIPAGNNGSLVTLTFKVVCPTCQNGDQCELHFSNPTDDLIGWALETGMFNYYCGTATPSPTPTLTPTVTQSPTFSPTNTPTLTPTPTVTYTPTRSPSPTSTNSPTTTPTNTSTGTPIPTMCADNLPVNPGFEDWDENGPYGPPDGWKLSQYLGYSASRDIFFVFDGAYSCKLNWSSTVTQELYQKFVVTAGETYDFRLRYYDDDPAGRIRLWIRWEDSQGGFIDSSDGGYSTDAFAWQYLEALDETAPAGAVFCNLQIRMYDDPELWDGNASVTIDNIEACGLAGLTPTPFFTETPGPPTPTEVPTLAPTATMIPGMCYDNLPVNPGFERWFENGSDGPPDGWALSQITGFSASQETDNVYYGDSSCNLTWTNPLTQELYQIVPVYAGEAYDFRLRFYDNDDAGRIRLWIRWEDSLGFMIGIVDGGYSTESDEWQVFERLDQTAPSGAVQCNIQIRMYDIPDNWDGNASVIIDNMEMCGSAPVTPSPYPTDSPTFGPTLTPTHTPTFTPTDTPTLTPTPPPTNTPTLTPTSTASPTSTLTPTEGPTLPPTLTPTAEPTSIPTEIPTQAPTIEPTTAPTGEPTEAPTVEPTSPFTATPDITRTPAFSPTPAPVPALTNSGIIAVMVILGGILLLNRKRN